VKDFILKIKQIMQNGGPTDYPTCSGETRGGGSEGGESPPPERTRGAPKSQKIKVLRVFFVIYELFQRNYCNSFIIFLKNLARSVRDLMEKIYHLLLKLQKIQF
jgi:hypothetical protein